MSKIDHKLREIVQHYFGIDDENLELVVGQLRAKTQSGGGWLFRQGDPGDSLYFLLAGRLQALLEIKGEDGRPTTKLLGEVTPGESVGEYGLLTGEPRTAGIRAVRDSLLMELSRDSFEFLARRHPELVMQLMGRAASLMHHRSQRPAVAVRDLTNITVQPLDDSNASREFCSRLAGELSRFGATLELSSGTLTRVGAPTAWREDGAEVPDSLVRWVRDQEEDHRFVIYRCDAGSRGGATNWSHFCIRQSDLLVLVGEAGADPSVRGWETELRASHDASISRRMLVLLQGESAREPVGTAAWLKGRDLNFHLHVRSDQPRDLERVARVIAGRALGLVLSGGAARGFAHLGVYRALREAGVEVDWVGGSSIGGIMGAAIARDWTPEEAIDRARESFVSGKPFSDFTIPLISLLNGRRMRSLLRENMDIQIEDTPLPFFCVSSNLDEGRMIVHERGSMERALRATASLPGILPPTVVDQRLTIDGSVLNNLPVTVMREKPIGEVLAVDLSTKKTYKVAFDETPSPWAILKGRLLPFSRGHRVPGLMTLMLKSTELGTMTQVRAQVGEADLLLRPDVRKFGLTEVKAFDRIVQAGYDCARSEIEPWLSRRGNRAEREFSRST